MAGRERAKDSAAAPSSDGHSDRAAGFDGAFLDVMDAWQYFKESEMK